MQKPVDGPGEEASPDRGKPIFAARLTPYRSLGEKGFVLLMLFVGASCFASGILFISIGAWPVFGFFGLDALLIWGAFKLNYRSGRAFEEVAVWRDDIEFRQVSPAGRARIHRLNPFWTRFVVERHEEFGIVRMALRERNREIDIGAFLNPSDRDSFAMAFNAVLAKARH
ncbi:MAG: DUF2244 domain-containing protein [Nitratireductor sp.]|nr:DUF2244 domain-containing protein [Nitratireductor sp.]